MAHTGPGRGIEELLRQLAPHVLASVVRRYGHFDLAEDATQEALLAAATQWPRAGVPDQPRGWLITVTARRLTDLLRSESAGGAAKTPRHCGQLASGLRPVPTSGPRPPTIRSSCCSCAAIPRSRRPPRSR